MHTESTIPRPARVLFIEPDRNSAELVTDSCEAVFGEVVVERAPDLASGLEFLQTTKPELILLAVDGKAPDHLRPIAEVREQHPDAPLIVLTSADDPELGVAVLRQGAQDCLSKAELRSPRLKKCLRFAVERGRHLAEWAELTSELRETNVRLAELANLDPLTGLRNRRGIESAFRAELAQSRRMGSSVVAVLVDCDDFKSINDIHGHQVGDAVLREVARRLLQTLRPSDHISRIGGDEFLVMLPHSRLAEGLAVADRLRRRVGEEPVHHGSTSILVTVSLGVATMPPGTATIEEILTLTHGALKQSKQSGKNRSSTGESVSVKVKAIKRPIAATAADKGGAYAATAAPSAVRLDAQGAKPDVYAEIRAQDHFRAAVQAIFDLQTEDPVGYEFCSRWPGQVFERPEDFFRLCRERDVLTSADISCLQQCLDAAGQMHDLQEVSTCSVNVFPSTLACTPIDRLIELCSSSALAGKLCLEISEQHFVGDPSYMSEAIALLKRAGVRVALDDVGFGRTSFESLIVLRPDIVKIDRNYVCGLARSPVLQRHLARLLRVANSVGARTIAEGIESREDLTAVKALGIHGGQGYLWGPPETV